MGTILAFFRLSRTSLDHNSLSAMFQSGFATTLASSFSTWGCILCNLFNCILPWTSSTEGKSSFLQSLALFHRPGIAGVVLPVNMKSKVSSTVSFMTRSPFPFRCTNRSSTCIFLPNHVSASTSSMLFLSGSLWSTFVCFAVHLGGGDTWKLNKLTWTALLSRTISYRIFPSRSLNMLKSALRRSRFVIPLF